MAYCSDAPGTRCLYEQPGLRALWEWCDARWPLLTFLGIYNCRDVGRSLHAEGRALDLGANAYNASGLAVGNAVFNWLIDHAEPVGVQQVIWNRRIWSANKPTVHSYTGPSPHTDHVHVGLCWATAKTLTVARLDQIGGPPQPPPQATYGPVIDVPGDPVQRQAIQIPTDPNGNGQGVTTLPVDKIVSVTFNVGDPENPNEGYRVPRWGKRLENGQNQIIIMGAHPSGRIDATVWAVS